MKFTSIYTNPKKFTTSEYLVDFWSTTLYGQSNLNQWIKGRSGLTMPDTIGSDDINILTPTLLSSNAHAWEGDKTRSAEKLLDGGSYTVYFKTKQVYAVNHYLLMFGNAAGWNQRGISIYNVGNTQYIMISDGVNWSETIQSVTDLATVGGWFEVFIEVDFATKRIRCKFYKHDGTVIGTSTNINISTYTFNANDNAVNLKFYNPGMTIADFKKFSGLKTLAQCQNNAYITDLQIYYPTIFDETDVSGNANHLTASVSWENDKYYSDKSTYLLDHGYTLYQRYNYPDIYVPNTPAGAEVVRTIAGYIRMKNVPGSLISHNLTDSYLEFTGTTSGIMDKSSATYFEDFTRDALMISVGTLNHYDVVNPKRWHITEINKITFNRFFKSGYRGLMFPKVTNNSHSQRNLLTEIFSFATNKTGSDLNKVLQYTNDSDITFNNLVFTLPLGSAYAISLQYKGIVGMKPVSFNWGDGAVTDMVMDGTLETIYHYFNQAGTYTIQVQNPGSLIEILMPLYPFTADASIFNTAINLEKIVLNESKIDHGSMSGWSSKMKYLEIWETNLTGNIISGSIDNMLDLVLILISGNNTMSGTLTDKIYLQKVFIAGLSTIGGDVSGLLDLRQLEKTGSTSHFWGTVNNALNFAIMCCDAPNEVTWNVSIGKKAEYNSTIVYSNFSGDISDCLNFWEMRAIPGFLGSLTNLTKLQTFEGLGSSIAKPTRFNNNPCLISFHPETGWIWTSTEVNQLLADLWTNRDHSKDNIAWDGITYPKPGRGISLNTVGSGAPTGQGIIDKANLEAYRSPNNDPACNLWTITTN